MANEVSYRHTTTGESLYFTIRNTSSQMWNSGVTPNYESLTVANWNNYNLRMSEIPPSSYLYCGDFPAIGGNMVAGWNWVDIFKEATSGTPIISDDIQASYFGYWDGTTYKWWADDMLAVNGNVSSAARLALSAAQIIPGTVDNTFTPTTTQFEADDITEATADHYNGRVIIFTGGALAGQATDITDYSLSSGRGHFTVTALTEAPGNNDTFVIV